MKINKTLLFFIGAFIIFLASKLLGWSYLVPTTYIVSGLIFIAYKAIKK